MIFSTYNVNVFIPEHARQQIMYADLSVEQGVSAALHWITSWSRYDWDRAALSDPMRDTDNGEYRQVMLFVRLLDRSNESVGQQAALRADMAGASQSACNVALQHRDLSWDTILKHHHLFVSERDHWELLIERSGTVEAQVRAYAEESGMSAAAMNKYLLSTHPELLARRLGQKQALDLLTRPHILPARGTP